MVGEPRDQGMRELVVVVAREMAELLLGQVSRDTGKLTDAPHDEAEPSRLTIAVLGVLVAVIKLLDLASVEPGAGLIAFVALMLLMVATSATLDRELV